MALPNDVIRSGSKRREEPECRVRTYNHCPSIADTGHNPLGM